MKNRGFNVDYVPPNPGMMSLWFVIEQILIERVIWFEVLKFQRLTPPETEWL